MFYGEVMGDFAAVFDESPKMASTARGYAVETATFDAEVIPGSESVRVTVELPSLDAAVVGESVADVVEDGWFETLDRRLEGVVDVTPASVTAPVVDRFTDTVVVAVEVTPRQGSTVEDVLAVVNFIEGTWVGGIIPGYEYVEAVESVRSSAAETGGTDHSTTPE